MIPAEAVEAAAWSVYNVLHPKAAATSLGQVGEPMRVVAEGIALAALEAAAPYIRAQAWDEGYEQGTLSQFQEPNNPYRAAAERGGE